MHWKLQNQYAIYCLLQPLLLYLSALLNHPRTPRKKIIKISFFITTLICHTTMCNRFHRYLLQFEIRTVGYLTKASYNSSTYTYE
jgi:hypothetical protein